MSEALRARSRGLAERLSEVPLLPILTVDEVDSAVQAARILHEVGFRTFELTLRTPAAAASVRAIARDLEGLTLGVGTVRRPADVELAREIGADFIVTPGMTPALHEALAADDALPSVPGAGSTSELMRLAEAGHQAVKWFPAEALGGVAGLQAVAAVLPELRFCPTGGIDQAKTAAYLALSCVCCVGASWPCPRDWMAAGEWPSLRERAAQSFTQARSRA